MSWFSFILILFACSWACVGIFRWYAIEKGMIDAPGPRSSHFVPTPRGGGVIFFLGWILLLVVFSYLRMISLDYLWLFSPIMLVGLIGFWDDHKGLSISLRLVVQAFAAAASLFLMVEGGDIVYAILPIPLPLCFLILVMAIVWMTNLFNFMDGADGIVATQSIMIFSVGGYILLQYHAYELGTLAWGLVALLAGFLTWNWPTARIFMGDCGSTFLGFLTALYALISYKFYHVPLTLWIILTSVFWFDATLTLIRRILAKQDIRVPHRLHAFQRLIQAGWSHQKVLLCIIAVNMVLGALTLIALKDPRLEYFALGVSVTLLTCLYIIVEIIKPMFRTWHKDFDPKAMPAE